MRVNGFIIVLLSLLVAGASSAQTWIGQGVNTNWATGPNWAGGLPPVNDGTAQIILAGSVGLTSNVSSPFNISSIAFDNTAGAFNVTGSNLTLNAATSLLNNSSATESISNPIILQTQSQQWISNSGIVNVNGPVNLNGRNLSVSGLGQLNFGGVISGVGDMTISGGPRTFTGTANTYTGMVTVLNGGIRLAKAAGLNATITGPLVIGNGTDLATVAVVNSEQISDSSTVTINANGILDLSLQQERVGSVVFNGGTVDASSGLFRVANSVTSNASNTTATILGGFQLDTFTTFAVAPGTTPSGIDLNVNAILVGASGGVVKTGAGTLRLSIANTYAGQTSLNGGTLVVANNQAISTSALLVNAGSTLRADGGPRVLSNAITFNNVSLTIDGPTDLTLNGALSGGGGMIKIGPGTVTYGGSSLNSYLGTTTVNEGRLNITKPAGITAIRGPLIVGDGIGGALADVVTQTNSGNLLGGPVTINNSGLWQPVSESISTLALTGGQVLASGTLTVAGGITTNADANTAVIGAGSLALSAPTFMNIAKGSAPIDLDIEASINGGNVQVHKTGPGTLRMAGSNFFNGTFFHDAGTIVVGNDNVFGGAPITVNGGTLQADGPHSILNRITLAGGLTVDGPDSLSLFQLLGTGGITKNGTGNLALGGSTGNFYTGTTIVNAGVLELHKLTGPALAGPLIIGDGIGGAGADVVNQTLAAQLPGLGAEIPITIRESGQLNLQFAGEWTSILSITGGSITGPGGIAVTDHIDSLASSNSATIAGALDLTGSFRTINVQQGAAPIGLDVSANVGGGGINKNGAGTLRLSGQNTFPFGLTINAGSVILSNDSAAGTGLLSLNGGTFAIDGSRTLTNDIDLETNLAVNNTFDLTLNGTISGPGAIVRSGGGFLRLAGNNTFAGGLTFNAGTLFLASDTPVGNGKLFLNGGALVVEGVSRDLPNDVALGIDLNLPGPNSLSFAGAATLTAGNRKVNVGANTSLGFLGGIGQDAPGRSLTKTGAGTLVLAGTSTFTGPLTILAGTVESSGDLAANVFNRGTFIFNGGALGGSFTNQGTFTLNADFTAAGGFDNQTSLNIAPFITLTANGAGLSNIGAMTLDGGAIAGSGVLNDFGGTFAARGNIDAPFNNNGALTLTGLLTVSGPMTNFGPISIATNQSLRPTAGLTNSGPITLTGGSISGTGAITNSPGGIIRGNGAVSSPLTNDGGLLYAPSGSALVLSNLTGGNLNGGVMQIDDNAQINAIAPFASSGLISLKGPAALLSGGAIANTGSIVGSGRITNPLANSGIIRAEGGTLTVAGASATNTATGQIQAPTGATVFYTQGLSSNAGGIALAGGTFDNSSRALTNSATGIIGGHGVLRTGGLTNNGLISFADGAADIFGPVTNNANLNVTSSLSAFYNAVVNSGTGRIKNTSGTIRFLGPFTNQPGGQFLSDPADNLFLDLNNAGLVSGGAGDHFTVSGELANSGSWSASGSDLHADHISNSGTFAHTNGSITSAGPFNNTAGTATIGGTQNWSNGAQMNVSGGVVNLQTDAGATGPHMTVQASAGGQINLNATQHLAGVTLKENAIVQLAVSQSVMGKVLATQSLSIADNAKLDLTNNAMIVDYTGASPLVSIRQSILKAYTNGTWQGPGLTSSNAMADFSKAIGYGEATALPTGGTFAGETPDSTSVVVRYTLRGDANLDGAVGFADLVAVAQHYGNTSGSATWSMGDLNYDGNVGFADLVAVAQNYGRSLPSVPVPGATPAFGDDLNAAFGAAVPEPGCLAIAGAAGASLCCRRKRF